jgi:hypothetical protein
MIPELRRVGQGGTITLPDAQPGVDKSAASLLGIAAELGPLGSALPVSPDSASGRKPTPVLLPHATRWRACRRFSRG